MDEIIETSKKIGEEELKCRIYKLIREKDSDVIEVKDLLATIDNIDWAEKRDEQIENETNDLIYNK